ncbi:hypothetical protein [Nocardia sp. NPDC004123]
MAPGIHASPRVLDVGALTTEQQFLRDAAAAEVISNDPNVKADVNLQAGSESTAAIYSLATGVCTGLNNGANKSERSRWSLSASAGRIHHHRNSPLAR